MHRSAPRAALVANACLGPLAAEASATVTCIKSTFSGTASNPGDITLGSGTFSTPGNPNIWCGGLSVQLVPLNQSWLFSPVSSCSGVTLGKITGFRLRIVSWDGCQAEVSGPSGGPGTLDATYTNATARLRLIDGNLRVVSTNGLCDPLLINVGDTALLEGAYKATPALSIAFP